MFTICILQFAPYCIFGVSSTPYSVTLKFILNCNNCIIHPTSHVFTTQNAVLLKQLYFIWRERGAAVQCNRKLKYCVRVINMQ